MKIITTPILKFASALTVATVVAHLSGCEWSSGGGAESYNGRYSFVNFSGSYRGINGGLLVTDYTKTGANSTNLVSGETIATGNGSKTSFSGTLRNKPLLNRSVTIVAPPSYTFTDDGNGNLDAVTPAGSPAFGVVNYQTGAWSLDFQGAAIDNGAKIVASYQTVYSSTASSGGSSSSGASGTGIHSFLIEHIGNVLSITDNNAAEYRGTIGDIRTTGGLGPNSSTGTVSAGDVFIGSFTAEGRSAAGVKVKIVGTLNGVVEGSGGSFRLAERTLTGNWIESTGKVGDILGRAEDLAITISGVISGQ